MGKGKLSEVTNTAQVRESNIELLRIILMFMVILLHFNNGNMGGAFNLVERMSFSGGTLWFLESLSVCAVNCFMIISGYFLAYNKKVEISKIADLLLIVIFYRFLNYVVSDMILQQSFSIKSVIKTFIPANYFAIFYIVTYVFSPFLSVLFDNLQPIYQKRFVFLCISIFVLIPTFVDMMENIDVDLYSISPVLINGSGAGYTIVQFFVAMIIGIFLRRCGWCPKISLLLGVYVGLSLIVTILIGTFPSLYNYSNIFTVITAVCVFLIFKQIKCTNKLINYISKSVFSIFCIHTSGIANKMWRQYCITPEHINEDLSNLVIWTIISVGGMFCCCLVIDIVFRNTLGVLKDKLLRKLPSLLCIKE